MCMVSHLFQSINQIFLLYLTLHINKSIALFYMYMIEKKVSHFLIY